MKNKEKYDLNTLKIEWTPLMFKKRLFTVKVKRDGSIIFSKKMKPNEIGTSAYNAWLEQEYEPKILDEKEKEYLSAVIKPFRKKVKYIEKRFWTPNLEYLGIRLKNNEFFAFPNFKKGKMYKGMEHDKYYTLEDLGL